MKLILASASPRRAEILRDGGMSFSAMPLEVNETSIPGESAHDHVQRLASVKAELVAARSIGPAIVIGADTVVTIDDHIIGKPRSIEDARRTLTQLSGRALGAHRNHTDPLA